MIDINILLSVVAIAVIIAGIIAIIVALRELVTGSYKRYAEMERQHFEQLQRVRKELRKGDSNGR